ncbi:MULTISPECIES: dipeptidase [Thermaerobacter]|uniref:Dipeptidase n=1 Tax=Thermaerobacter composti TaxID=554949 RepID=A0ABZ0QSJ0_9FIRM|nr:MULTISPECIES: dipeptidase [Thermaerobacter]QBS37883.1 membrane dipeptidase [Thermaerobacter sp. FW80]WPD20048.1 dipeptidase [Thermaerobacter composti]
MPYTPYGPIVDAHVDTVLDLAAGRRRLGERSPEGHVDLPRLEEAGVGVQVFAHWIEPAYKPHAALVRFMELYDAFLAEVARNADRIAVVTGVDDLQRTLAAGKVAAVVGIEGGEVLHGRLGVLRLLHRLGVRLVGLTWNERNDLADGAGDGRSGGGLSQRGVAVVREMNRLGMVVDVSHLSDAGFYDVLAVSRQPVVASHSNCRALCPHPRNLSDDQIRALAAQGGVMGMNFYARFLRADGPATVDDVVRHIEHVASLVGPEHVGLGSDFDGIGETPQGLEDVTRLPNLIEALLRRNWKEDHLRLVLAENFLRVFRQVWSAGEPAYPAPEEPDVGGPGL